MEPRTVISALRWTTSPIVRCHPYTLRQQWRWIAQRLVRFRQFRTVSRIVHRLLETSLSPQRRYCVYAAELFDGERWCLVPLPCPNQQAPVVVVKYETNTVSHHYKPSSYVSQLIMLAQKNNVASSVASWDIARHCLLCPVLQPARGPSISLAPTGAPTPGWPHSGHHSKNLSAKILPESRGSGAEEDGANAAMIGVVSAVRVRMLVVGCSFAAVQSAMPPRVVAVLLHPLTLSPPVPCPPRPCCPPQAPPSGKLALSQKPMALMACSLPSLPSSQPPKPRPARLGHLAQIVCTPTSLTWGQSDKSRITRLGHPAPIACTPTLLTCYNLNLSCCDQASDVGMQAIGTGCPGVTIVQW